MEEKKVIKIKLNTIIAIVLVVLSIFGAVLYMAFSNKYEFSMSNTEIKKIASDSQYKIKDKQLEKFFNDLLKEGETLIVSKESAKTLEDAERLSIEYKNKLNIGLANDNIVQKSESYTDFEYINFIETDYYYKYIGEYTYQYSRTSNKIMNKYTFLIFKSDYFEYPYLKKYNDDISIKEFGDILSVINYGNNKIIESEVKDNEESFIYNLYYVFESSRLGGSNGSSGFDTQEINITGVDYFLNKATFTVNKLTGKTDLDIKQGSYQGYMDYENSYYPCMDIETIKSFYEGK